MLPSVTFRCKLRIFSKILSRIPENCCLNKLKFIQQANYSLDYTSFPVKMAMDVFESHATNPDLPPIVIMHGLFGSKNNWRSVAKGLEKKTKRKIYNVDARNHGDSPHVPEHDSPCVAADLAKMIQDHKLGKVSCIGHSMGGRAMMYLALLFPKLVEKLIPVDISPVSMPQNIEYMYSIFEAMKNIKVPSELTREEGKLLAANQLKDEIPDNRTVDFLVQSLKKSKSGEFVWTFNIVALQKNFAHFQTKPEKTRHFEGPTLFICGKYSNFMKRDDWPEIKKLFPNAEIKWLDCGHLIHMEKPGQFIKAVSKFLKS